MSLAGALVFAASGFTPPVYPVEVVLSELQAVCHKDERYTENPRSGSISEAISFWEATALENGWSPITLQTERLTRIDRNALGVIDALNHTLFGNFAEHMRYSDDVAPMLGGQVFKKTVARRELYLSLFGADDGSWSAGECRIHDLLGDGVSKNPVSRTDVQQIAGGEVKKLDGPFGSDRYRWWPNENRMVELDVHFGFKGWRITPFSEKVENFDPYALTLVAGFHEQIIVV